MFFNVTYTNKEAQDLINDCFGKSFNFIEKIKLGGIGSKRMIIEDTSNDFKSLLPNNSDICYGNLELRPLGLLIFINIGLKRYVWGVPYRLISIYKSESFSIHSQGNFIRFKNNKLLKENKSFVRKLLDFKSKNNNYYNVI